MDVSFDDLDLTKRQSIFVKEYVATNNGTQAAIAAGFSEKGAAVTASRLLKHPKIQEALKRIRASVVNKVNEPLVIKANLEAATSAAEAIGITSHSLICELAEMGMTQRFLKKFLTQQDGHLFYDFSTATEEELAAISPQIAEVHFESETTTKASKVEGEPPSIVRTVRSKVKWVNRKDIIELMGRYKEIMAWGRDAADVGDVHIHVTRSVVGNSGSNLASPERVAQVIDAIT